MKKIISLLTLILFTSCNTDELSPPSGAQKKIYICGSTFKNGYVPQLWINKTPHNYEPEERNGRADDMAFLGDDIYTVGLLYDTNGTTFKHVIWKNFKVIKELTSTGSSYPYSIAVNKNNSDIYVLGLDYQTGTLPRCKVWKNGIATLLSNIDGTMAYDIKINNNDVFVVGSLPVSNVDRAVFWKNGMLTYLTDGTNEAEAEAITITNNDIYIAGREKNNNGKWVAKYWKNGVVTNLTDGSKDAHVNTIEINNNNIYIGGSEKNANGISEAKYWKNGVETILNNDEGLNSSVYSLAFLSNIPYSIGYKNHDANSWFGANNHFKKPNSSFRKIIIK